MKLCETKEGIEIVSTFHTLARIIKPFLSLLFHYLPQRDMFQKARNSLDII